MDKIKLFWSDLKQGWISPDPNKVESLLECYRVADVDKRIAELEAEVARLKGDSDSYDNTYKRNLEYQRENGRLRDEITRLRKALEAAAKDIPYYGMYHKTKAAIVAALEASDA